MLLNKIKSLFIVDDTDPLKKALEKKAQEELPVKSEETIVPSSETTAPDHTPVTPPSVPSSEDTPQASPGQVTDKFMNVLLQSMEGANLDGFDYLEYKQALQSLGNMNMDEAMRYQSAFAMAKTMGTTPEHLLQTANHYLVTLAKEEEKFGTALENQRTTQIGDRHSKIEKLSQLVADKQKRIETLQAEIAQHKEDAHVIKSEIDEATVKVENTKNNFFVTYKVLIGQIQTDIEKMKQYL